MEGIILLSLHFADKCVKIYLMDAKKIDTLDDLEDAPESQRKGKVIVQISNMPGYQGEYRMHIDSLEYTPQVFSRLIEQTLGEDWDVSNRGTRIEVTNLTGRGMEVVRDDKAVIDAVRKAALFVVHIVQYYSNTYSKFLGLD